MSSEWSAEIRWSIVGMLHPALTVTDCPDLMVIGDSIPAFGQTWLVAMVPTEQTTQAVDFLPGVVDAEFAVVFDEGSAPQIKGPKAVIHDVSLQNRAALTEKCFAQMFAVGLVGRGKSLEGFSVANSDEVLFTNVWNDRDIGGKVEIDWQ